MSSLPPGPQHPLPRVEPDRGRSPELLAALVVGLVLVVVGASFLGWKLLGDGDEDPASAPLTPSPSSTGPLPSTPPALAAFYDQELDWSRCGGNRCAVLTVPLDYDNPGGATLDLSVLKVPARDQKSKVGALVVNPGGPGGSGVGFAAAGSEQFGSRLTRYYDIVGFDPRGVGESTPLQCLSTSELDEVLAYDPDPDTPAEVAGMDEVIAGFGQGCLDESGELVRHMSTKEAATDMDVLRAALGQAKLDYLGSSYGTFLGATYAELFPGNVGRFVLDGALDPSLSTAEMSLQQGQGFEVALRAYVKDCVDDGGCFLGRTVDDGTKRIRELLDDLDAKPLGTGESRELTEGLGMMGIWMPLYVQEYWPYLSDALRKAFDGDGSGLLGLADAYAARGEDGFEDNSMEALYAVNCLDHGDSVPSSEVPQYIAEFEKASPTFGRAFAYSLSTCASWPVQSGEKTRALQAKGTPPIVVIGTTRDPATPLRWAQAMAAQLDSGTLITRDGDGHTGFQRGSACVDDAVERWLVEGKAPKPDLMCD